MVVGAALVELHVHGSRSLKEKRGVVRSISRRVRNRFNCSVAEVGGHGTWQRALLALTTAGGDGGSVRSALERVIDFVDGLHLAEVVGSDVELVSLPHREAGGGDEDLGDFDWEAGEED